MAKPRFGLLLGWLRERVHQGRRQRVQELTDLLQELAVELEDDRRFTSARTADMPATEVIHQHMAALRPRPDAATTLVTDDTVRPVTGASRPGGRDR